jgi:hypothetical protein
MFPTDSEVDMAQSQSKADPVSVWLQHLESVESELVTLGPCRLSDSCDVVQILSELAQTDEVAERLESDEQLRWRWDRVWAATDTGA